MGVNFPISVVNAILVNVEVAVEVDKRVLAAVGMGAKIVLTGMLGVKCVMVTDILHQS